MQWWILTIYTHITVFCSLACYFWTIIDGAAEEAFSVIIYVRLINSIAEQNFQKNYFDWLKYGHIYRVLSFLLLLHLTTCEAEAEPMCFSRRKLRHINQTPTHLLLALNEQGKRTLSLTARDTQTGNWVWERWLAPWRTPWCPCLLSVFFLGNVFYFQLL